MQPGAPEPIAALNRVRIVECHEPLVDMRVACPRIVTLARARPFVRQRVAQMLNDAADRLPAHLRLRVSTALRTIDDQRRHWDAYFARMRSEHPEWPESALHRAVNRFFAPYDQPAPPGHCTGGAVDVQLMNDEGELLDMTSPLNGWEAAPTWIKALSSEARRNRFVMVRAMLDAGFSNCRDEYWHYSWGDSAWAVRVGERTCPYGLVKPPPAALMPIEC
jgi:D-alanyl-D-alanine dipeptidase